MHKRGSNDSIRGSVPSTLRALHMPATLRHDDGAFTNARGESLSYLALFPALAVPLRGVVVFIHGFSMHARRYCHVYERLCEHGFGVVAYDLLGHGESALGHHRVRAHADKFQYFVDDTNAFVTFAKQHVIPQMLWGADARDTASQAEPTRSSRSDSTRQQSQQASESMTQLPPLVLIGTSYGTLIALHTLLSNQHAFAGVVLVSPTAMIEWRPLLRLQSLFVRPLAKLLPTLRAIPAAKQELICRDPGFLEDYYNDPLTVADNMTLRMAAQSLKACQALEKEPRFDDPNSAVSAVPVLFMIGSADKVTSVPLAMQFFDRLRSRDKALKVFDGMYHSLLHDPEREEVFAHLVQWLEMRFPECLRPSSGLFDTVAAVGVGDGNGAPLMPRAEEKDCGLCSR